MNRRKQLVLAALSAFCAWATPTAAQTTANGPYYATPAWDQTLPAATRFIVLSNFKSEAVLDRETGLVWERTPSPVGYGPTLAPGVFGGIYASEHCLSATTGGRMGWRQPSVAELMSLIVPSASPGVPQALPAGHPFELGFSETFWTSTRYYPDRYPLAYRTVSIMGVLGAADGGTLKYPVWCVRGGSVAAVH
nr:DUF1566 domain-containing protein [Variovorax boronicumulans]